MRDLLFWFVLLLLNSFLLDQFWFQLDFFQSPFELLLVVFELLQLLEELVQLFNLVWVGTFVHLALLVAFVE